MQAGLVYGYLGEVEFIINKFKSEIDSEEPIRVVATGGYGRMFYEETDLIDYYDAKLALKGLKLVYDKNKKCTNKYRPEV